MLTLTIDEQELYDSEKEIFFYLKPATVQLEHSLISMSKWESIWCKPFLPTKGEPPTIENHEQELSYIACMIIGKSTPELVRTLYGIHGEEIRNYIAHPSTATTINRIGSDRGRQKIVTTELIYSWMVRFGIPFECEKWHINRLLTLVEICNIQEKQASGKNNLTPKEAAQYTHALNRARRGK